MTDLDKLDVLAAAATPGPWIRKWASLDVKAVTEDSVLNDHGDLTDRGVQVQRNIDFAVALVNEYATIRDLVAAARRGEEYREALIGLDAAFQWIENEYPKALTAMPSHLFASFGKARAALDGTEPRQDELQAAAELAVREWFVAPRGNGPLNDALTALRAALHREAEA